MNMDLPLRSSTTLWKRDRVLTLEQVTAAIENELRKWYGVEPVRSDGAVRALLPLVRRGQRSLNDWFSGPTFGETREVAIDVREADRGFGIVVTARKSVLPSLIFTGSAVIVGLALHASALGSVLLGGGAALVSWGTAWSPSLPVCNVFETVAMPPSVARGA